MEKCLLFLDLSRALLDVRGMMLHGKNGGNVGSQEEQIWGQQWRANAQGMCLSVNNDFSNSRDKTWIIIWLFMERQDSQTVCKQHTQLTLRGQGSPVIDLDLLLTVIMLTEGNEQLWLVPQLKDLVRKWILSCWVREGMHPCQTVWDDSTVRGLCSLDSWYQGDSWPHSVTRSVDTVLILI